MVINNGYQNIKVKLLNFDKDLAKHAYEFGRWGESIHFDLPEHYDNKDMHCRCLIQSIIFGKTFPKYSFLGTRIDFSVEGISRICLSQLTRDDAIFCSGTHGTMPVKQEYNVPMNIFKDSKVMSKVEEAYKLLESAYVDCLKSEVPYPEARYILPGNLVINCNCSFTPMAFARACYSRTNNSFCDELNYVYRKMFLELSKAIDSIEDDMSKSLWKWLINEKKCIDDNHYVRASIFNSDFNPDMDYEYEVPAQNDWTKSCWKMELERIIVEEPELLTSKEISIIANWIEKESNGEQLYKTYDENDRFVGKNYVNEVYNGKDI